MPHFTNFFSKKDVLIGTGAFVLGGIVSLWMNPIIAALGPATLLAGGGLTIVYVTRLKKMLNILKNIYKFTDMCGALHDSDQPKRLIAEVFDPLSSDKKGPELAERGGVQNIFAAPAAPPIIVRDVEEEKQRKRKFLEDGLQVLNRELTRDPNDKILVPLYVISQKHDH